MRTVLAPTVTLSGWTVEGANGRYSSCTLLQRTRLTIRKSCKNKTLRRQDRTETPTHCCPRKGRGKEEKKYAHENQYCLELSDGFVVGMTKGTGQPDWSGPGVFVPHPDAHQTDPSLSVD